MNTELLKDELEIDEALATDIATRERQSKERLAAVNREREKVSRIGTALRYVGIAILFAATGSFMFQRWGEMNHLARYLSFLVFTVGVCAAGLLCGLKIKENKGARTLLGVVVALIPVHAAQLGAFLFSWFGAAQTDPASYPSALYWSVTSLSDALIAVGVGVGTLVPMALMAYSVLARAHARQLLVLGCGVSAALLVPTRDPFYVGAIMAIASAVALVGEVRLSSAIELRTREGLIARSVPFLAIAMMIGRQCFLYNATSLFMGFVYLVASAVLFEMVPRLKINALVTILSEHASIPLMALAALYIGDACVEGFGLAQSVAEPLVFGLPIGIAFTAMAERARESAGAFRAASSVAFFCTGLAELMSMGSVQAGIVALLVGIVALTVACVTERKGLFLAGVSLVVLSLGRVVLEAFANVSVSPWVILGAIGVATIVGASYIERNFIRLRDEIFALRKRVAAWR